MDTEQALLQAILAEPKDDTPRLVYADWLDENAGTVECPKCKGRPTSGFTGASGKQYISWCDHCSGSGRVSDGRAQRAEFIRVQIRLANNQYTTFASRHDADVNPNNNPPCPCEWCALRRRERELWPGHVGVSTWMGIHTDGDWNMPPDGGEFPIVQFREMFLDNAMAVTISRGFVSAITCTWAAWCEHADEILKQQPVEKVRPTGPIPSLTVTHEPYNRNYIFWMEERGRRVRRIVPEREIRATYPNRDLVGRLVEENLRELVLDFCKGEWPKIKFELPQTDVVADATVRYDEAIRRIDQLGGLPRVRPGRPVRR